MNTFQKISVFALRVSLGWMFLWAGVTKLMDPAWSAEGYLKGAQTFSWFYHWVAGPALLPVTNFANAWGLTLLGISLLLGVFVRISSFSGAALMLLYYFPILKFPYPNPHAFLVDEHIIYITALLCLAAFHAGRTWGLENWCSRLPICAKFPKLRYWLD